MSNLTIELPESIHAELERLARDAKVTPSQFLAAAAAEKICAWHGADFLKREAALSKEEDWVRVLDLVPVQPPLPGDELPQ
ncbi:MAG: toxin-antitoxin system HicB family antitoxin [Verrucomicrobiales bacterium]|nr:toxin-antitoxin system HicB family antitoxin [Verrucomicrobiales bacterium]